jgi:hypothetical protein
MFNWKGKKIKNKEVQRDQHKNSIDIDEESFLNEKLKDNNAFTNKFYQV